MSSHQSSTSDRKPSDTSSILSSSTTSSMSALLKSKFTPKSKGKPSKPDDDLSPGEKQAKRQAGRTSPQTLATWASMRDKALSIIDRPGEDDVLDAYAARRATMLLRVGSL